MIAAAVEAAMSGEGAITAQEVPPLQTILTTTQVYERSHGMMGRIIRIGCAARGGSGEGKGVILRAK